jgi:hypothetical protein
MHKIENATKEQILKALRDNYENKTKASVYAPNDYNDGVTYGVTCRGIDSTTHKMKLIVIDGTSGATGEVGEDWVSGGLTIEYYDK